MRPFATWVASVEHIGDPSLRQSFDTRLSETQENRNQGFIDDSS
jgi:hypothetical protein